MPIIFSPAQLSAAKPTITIAPIERKSARSTLSSTMRRSSVPVVLLFLAFLVVVVPQVSAKRYIVGGNQGWSSNVNYTIWAEDKHFYLDDWLFFVYDRHQASVLEVNKTNYENCIPDHPLHNFTTGAGRDVVHLNQTRHYYFISSGGFCYGGMKLAIHVVKPPSPPKASPIKSNTLRVTASSYGPHAIFPVVFAIWALWDNFLTRLWYY